MTNKMIWNTNEEAFDQESEDEWSYLDDEEDEVSDI